MSTLTVPLASTKLVDQVFRAYQPGGTGIEFGEGLSPFAIVMSGHEGAKQVEEKMIKAQFVEAGTSVSLADATDLVANDVRFPTKVHVAVEKLYGWSVVVDVFHGPGQPISVAIRRAVTSICPLLPRMAENAGDGGTGLETVCRVMFDMQQDYFAWLGAAGVGPTPVPDFHQLINMVQTSRASSLSALPSGWYLMVTCPRPSMSRAPEVPPTAPPALREQTNSVPVVNTKADARLVQRYADSGHSSIKAMAGDRNLAIPKHNGQPVCLMWALKGACNSNCKRKALHVNYGRATVSSIHEYLTSCGVAAAPNA